MANDTIGSLTAVVRATATQFSTDMKQVEGSLDELKHHAEGIDFKEALGIGAAVELFHQGIELAREAVEGFFEAVEKGAQLSVLAEQLNVTTEQLSGLRFAAKEVELTTETLDNGLKKMLRSIGELKVGTKETVDAFRQLGLSEADFAGKDAAASFELIADRIKSLGNAADQTDVAMKIFSRSGADLLPLLNQGAAGIEKYIEENRKLGNEITGPEAESLKDLQDSIITLKASWEALEIHLASEVVPIIKVLVGMITDLTTSLSKNTGGVGQAIIEWVEIGAEIGAFLVIVPRVVAGLELIRTAFETMATAETIAEAIGDPAQLAIGIAAAGAAVIYLNDQFGKLNQKLADARAEAAKAAAAFDAKQKKMKEDREAAEADTVAHAKWAKALADAADVQKKLGDPLDKFKTELAHLNTVLGEGALSWDVYRKAVLKAGDEALKAIAAHSKLKEVTDRKASAGLDVRSTAGVTAELSASRFAQDLAQQRADLEREHLAEAKEQTAILQAIRDAGVTPGGAAVIDQVAEF